MQPFQRFAQVEASSGILLLAATAIALAWANSPWRGVYFDILHVKVGFTAGSFEFTKDLIHWINDGLMAIFFFVVGLEIKREILVGELAHPKRAALPIAAALGGMVVPALIYTALNHSTHEQRGWGVPMATDIAFALGVLALLGKRAPTSLKVFLAALAIADDMGAVAVIAIFYSEAIALPVLIAGLLLLCLSLGVSWAGVRSPWVFVAIGIVVWFAFLKSGVHATVAGVLLAFTVPAKRRVEPTTFLAQVQSALRRFRTEVEATPGDDEPEPEAVNAILQACREVQTPLQRMEHALQPWVSYAIMPVFALANAGVAIHGLANGEPPAAPVGVALGLALGKPIGIMAISWLVVRLRMAELPPDVRWSHIHGVGWLGGIGFTMALFIAGLAFKGTPTLDTVKLAILVASACAGTVGYFLLLRTKPVEAVASEA
jgi:NhaA family Na+:H+ antiporter